MKRRGAPMATTETAWQSLPLVCLSLSSSSLVLSSFFFVRFPLCLSTDVSDHLFSSPATPNSSPLSLYFLPVLPTTLQTFFLSLTGYPFLFLIAVSSILVAPPILRALPLLSRSLPCTNVYGFSEKRKFVQTDRRT